MYSKFGKRCFDLILTIPGLVLFSPLMLVIALLVRIKMSRPVYFKQVRPGLHNQPFTLFKFRTMTDVRNSECNHVPDDVRLTRLGQFLRSTSLDELPELWNIILGDMSLVGPRPLLMEYLDRYTAVQSRRHNVRPGLTGWAQVNGRNALSWEEKFKLDVWYVENKSLWLDVKILFMTLWSVLKRENIYPDGHSMMNKFMGNKDDV